MFSTYDVLWSQISLRVIVWRGLSGLCQTLITPRGFENEAFGIRGDTHRCSAKRNSGVFRGFLNVGNRVDMRVRRVDLPYEKVVVAMLKD